MSFCGGFLIIPLHPKPWTLYWWQLLQITGIFRAQSFVDMMERLWQVMHDLLLRMYRLTGIIFFIVQYNHIHITLRPAAARSLVGAVATAPPLLASSTSGGTAAGGPAATTPNGGVGAAAVPGPGPGVVATSMGIGRTGLTSLKQGGDEGQDQLASCTGLFVDDQLAVHFRELVDWVKKAEQAAKRSGVPEGWHMPTWVCMYLGGSVCDVMQRLVSSPGKEAQEEMGAMAQVGAYDGGRRVLRGCGSMLMVSRRR
ncbi:hypothetical protein Vafri_10920 [Volvox africanus]|uniref:Uncharacterized protein n=1 Tax=Volvox africanus TaxID=51714 RepID=A0A8J4BBL9_9CHLO|nr:hypothetical protein Vafri_10920 [Volvox africanus]